MDEGGCEENHYLFRIITYLFCLNSINLTDSGRHRRNPQPQRQVLRHFFPAALFKIGFKTFLIP
jgi:hypothetical protein